MVVGLFYDVPHQADEEPSELYQRFRDLFSDIYNFRMADVEEYRKGLPLFHRKSARCPTVSERVKGLVNEAFRQLDSFVEELSHYTVIDSEKTKNEIRKAIEGIICESDKRIAEGLVTRLSVLTDICGNGHHP